jgi:acetoin utilization deacetylase AcuC-like enzyme
MTTGFIYCEDFLNHDTGPGHPERPDRLRAIVERLRMSHLWSSLAHLPFEPLDRTAIERVHEPVYLDRLIHACHSGAPYIDVPDSAICPRSYDVARLAAGGAVAAVDAVMAGSVRNAFCAIRPPGHHAERSESMGFCLLNNVALAADRLVSQHRLQRVAVVDFDVHHGNGTQHLFEHRDDLLFVSVHQQGIYPGSGAAYEIGRDDGEEFTVNVPLPAGSGDDAYRAAFQQQVLPALARFQPQFLLISAGFDAAAADPLAHQRVSGDGFAWMTAALHHVGQEHCGGRLVSVLEGGYHLRSLADAVARHVAVLMGEE